LRLPVLDGIIINLWTEDVQCTVNATNRVGQKKR
jgi:hypothetical protein